MNCRTTILFVLMIAITFTACSRKGKMVFCEGTDADGAVVNPGTVFTLGAITLHGSFPAAFGTETVTIKLYDTEDGDILPEETQNLTVDPAATTFRTDFLIINESTYRAVAELKNGQVIGETTVKIIEDF